jgi:hypothetical protein
MPELSQEEQKALGIFLGALFLIGAAIIISQKCFPFFLVGSVILFGILIIVVIIDFIRDHDFSDMRDGISTYVGIIFLIFLVCTGITYFIGYGLGGTSFGQASINVYTSITGAEKAVDEATEQAINSLVETNCQVLSPADCTNLRNTAKTAKTLKEISDLADKLKMAEEVANAISE